MYRVGTGYDLHRLVKGSSLVLGGVSIPYRKGLAGHSDADVLMHALMDALLGAAAMRDIGYHFPPGDPRYAGMSSLLLLDHVKGLLDQRGFLPVNADMTVIAQEPRLSPYLESMQSTIAASLSMDNGTISVKATTTEGLGACGRGKAIAAHAVVLLKKESLSSLDLGACNS